MSYCVSRAITSFRIIASTGEMSCLVAACKVSAIRPRLIISNNALRNCGKIVEGCEKKENCWNCCESVKCTNHFFCKGCHTIQPLQGQNLFDYLGLPVSFEVEDTLLKKRFRDLQFQLHPDKFANASEKEKNISDANSRTLNEAFKTLSEPLARAKYLLEVLGVKDNKSDLDPSALMEIMEWNEKVAALQSDELHTELAIVQTYIEEELMRLGSHFSEKNIEHAKGTITKLSYLYSIRNAINKKIEASFST